LVDVRQQPDGWNGLFGQPSGDRHHLGYTLPHGGRASDAYHDGLALQAKDGVVGELDQFSASSVEAGALAHSGQHGIELRAGKAAGEVITVRRSAHTARSVAILSARPRTSACVACRSAS